MVFASWLQESVSKLKDVSPSAESDLRWLVESVTGKKAPLRIQDLTLPVDQENKLKEKIERRLQGEPVAYILGEWEFYGLTLKVGPGVLVPRSETETLVDLVLERFKQKEDLCFADLGSGSGCIAAALISNLSISEATVVEKSVDAFAYTKKNLEGFKKSEIKLLNMSTEDALAGGESKYDFIVANPPYISADDPDLEDNVRAFEPSEALFAANQGTAAIESWLQLASSSLKTGGFYFFEIGWKQESEVSFLLEKVENLKLVEVAKDLSGHPRVVICEKVVANG